MSKDKKARKLALQHWLEAVSTLSNEGSSDKSSLLFSSHLLTPLHNSDRLIPVIDMAIIFNFIMSTGFSVRVNSPSSTGKLYFTRKTSMR